MQRHYELRACYNAVLVRGYLQTSSSACLRIPFTQKANTGFGQRDDILFGISSKNKSTRLQADCRSRPGQPNGSARSLKVTGTATACVIELDSGVGPLKLLVPKEAAGATAGDKQKFAISL